MYFTSFGLVNAAKKLPHIIFIYTDDHAAWATGVYGGKDARTPHLDRIGREGAFFLNQYTLEPQDASRFGLKLFCSPDQEEETVITYDRQKQEFTIDFEKASLKEIDYDVGRHHPRLKRGTLKQTIPYTLPANQTLNLDIFLDRSILEIFVNSKICLVQRVYPTRNDSTQVRLFSEDGRLTARDLIKWEMDATNPW
tara:strand:- start:2522 stop:3109 length:588 start_codon:yes stop_codon:yes gene_type:complete